MAWTTTFEAESRGGVQEQRFVYTGTVAANEGIEVLYKYPVYISQIVASWTTSTTVTLLVQLPSGTSFTVKAYSSATSFTLNTRTDSYIYWMQLPAGSRLQFQASAALSNFAVSIISNPL